MKSASQQYLSVAVRILKIGAKSAFKIDKPMKERVTLLIHKTPDLKAPLTLIFPVS